MSTFLCHFTRPAGVWLGWWGSVCDTSSDLRPRHVSIRCNVHMSVAIFLDLNVPVFKRLKTWAFQWLKTHWLQPVFGGFLSPTGLIRNRPSRAAAGVERSRADVRPGSRAECGPRPGSDEWGPGRGQRSPDTGPCTGPQPANSFYRLQWEPSRSQTDNPFFAHHEMGKIGLQTLKTGVTEIFLVLA